MRALDARIAGNPMPSHSKNKGVRLSRKLFSYVASAIAILTVLSFPQFFIFFPLETGLDFLSMARLVMLIGLALLILLPPLAFRVEPQHWVDLQRLAFLTGIWLYTASTVAIKVYGLIVSGQWWVGYWVISPVLLFLEFLLPVVYTLMSLPRHKVESSYSS